MATKLQDLAAGAGTTSTTYESVSFSDADMVVLPGVPPRVEDAIVMSATDVPEALYAIMEQERDQYLVEILRGQWARTSSQCCKLCPFWTTKERSMLTEHIRNHHNRSNLYIANGTKQLFVL